MAEVEWQTRERRKMTDMEDSAEQSTDVFKKKKKGQQISGFFRHLDSTIARFSKSGFIRKEEAQVKYRGS